MVKCNFCGRDMLTSDGCDNMKIEYKGKIFDRIKVGDPGDFYENKTEGRCGDCGAKIGHYHHLGCNSEKCPVCKLQFISCDCDY